MNKAVLISIRPKWCEKIASGEKTVELRKTRPKLDTPFRCYIYSGGKVIGEFICNRINKLAKVGCFGGGELPRYRLMDAGFRGQSAEMLFWAAGITEAEAEAYLRGRYGFAWRISDLVIYDTPRELGEFTGLRTLKNGFELRELDRPPQSWCYVEEQGHKGGKADGNH